MKMQQPKKEARSAWKTKRATHKSREIVAHAGLRGRIAAMEAIEEGRKELFGWMSAIGLCALLAYIIVDMALGGAA